jgi:hypothetical protein
MFALTPLDRDDALALVEHLRTLIEWRHGNITVLPTGGKWLDRELPKLTVVPFKE